MSTLKVLLQVAFDGIDDFLPSITAHANIKEHPVCCRVTASACCGA
jgi:hypothetical protein